MIDFVIGIWKRMVPYNINNGVTVHDIAQSVGAYKVILI